jgi:hypothetical protein
MSTVLVGKMGAEVAAGVWVGSGGSVGLDVGLSEEMDVGSRDGTDPQAERKIPGRRNSTKMSWHLGFIAVHSLYPAVNRFPTLENKRYRALTKPTVIPRLRRVVNPL